VTDQSSNHPDPGESDDELAVRRLLAAARVQETIPEQVAARLQATLAAAAPVAPVRRRRVNYLIPVAAAVVVMIGGVGLFEVLLPHRETNPVVSATQVQDQHSPDQQGAAQPESGQAPSLARTTAPLASAESLAGTADQEGASSSMSTTNLPVVRPGHFVPDAQAALAQPVLAQKAAPQSSTTALECATGVVKPGDRSAVVSFRRVTARVVLDAHRLLTLYSCDGMVLLQRELD